jgi:hypothetical protein
MPQQADVPVFDSRPRCFYCGCRIRMNSGPHGVGSGDPLLVQHYKYAFCPQCHRKGKVLFRAPVAVKLG